MAGQQRIAALGNGLERRDAWRTHGPHCRGAPQSFSSGASGFTGSLARGLCLPSSAGLRTARLPGLLFLLGNELELHMRREELGIVPAIEALEKSVECGKEPIFGYRSVVAVICAAIPERDDILDRLADARRLTCTAHIKGSKVQCFRPHGPRQAGKSQSRVEGLEVLIFPSVRLSMLRA